MRKSCVKIERLLAVLLVALTAASASATNYPCSGKKGGISHCQGDTFICNDGSTSASKRSCQQERGSGGAVGLVSQPQQMTPATTSACPCRSGAYCTGPRGGHYCLTDGGGKSYLRN